MKHCVDFILGFAATAFGLLIVPSIVASMAPGLAGLSILFSSPGFVIYFFLLLVIPWAPAVVFMVLGIKKQRPGLIAAPTAFLALWVGTATWMQIDVRSNVAPELFDREIPEAARHQRTLIIPQSENYWRLLGNGHVDRLVVYQVGPNLSDITGLRSYTLGRGAECPRVPQSRTNLLRSLGRTDECVFEDELEAMPSDGLLLRWDRQYDYDGIGCCNELRFIILENGKERKIGGWRTGHAGALATLPIMTSFEEGLSFEKGNDHTVSVWGMTLKAPVKRIVLGAPTFDLGDVLDAIYGVGHDMLIGVQRKRS